MPKIKATKTQKEDIIMSVIIKLNGYYIGETTMTTEEIRKAEDAGFTILRNRKENK